jgi:hypothetical protein
MQKIFVDPRAKKDSFKRNLLRRDCRRAPPGMALRNLIDGSGAIKEIFRIHGGVNLYCAAAACGET